MFFKRLAVVPAIVSLVSCGGGSSVSYTDTVKAYSTEGLDTFTKGKAVADAYSDFSSLNVQSGGTTDSDTINTKLTTFTTALDDYNTHVQTIGSDAATTFQTGSSSSLSAVLKDDGSGFGSTGIDAGLSLKDLNDTLQTKKKECDDLKAKIPTDLSDLTKLADAKKAYENCVYELQQKAVEEGFKTVVVSSGGSAAGAGAAGGVFIYVVGGGAAALLTGPGLLVVGVGAIVGGKVATAIYEYCTSSSDKLELGPKKVSDNNYCAAASVKGTTGKAMPMNITGGTGTLHVFIDGYAPVMIQNVTVKAGQTTTVNISPVALDAVTDNSADTLSSANAAAAESESTTTASSCSDAVSLGAVNSPSDPGPGDTVTVTATLLPTIQGCSIAYSVVGTDGYTQAASPTTDSSGQVTFTIPGGAAGVNDVVTMSESSSGVSSTLTYVF